MAPNFFSLCLLGILIYFTTDNVAYEAIINGAKADAGRFLYQVSLQYEDHYPFCGGGIIHEQFVLTAAHCVIHDDNTFETNRMFVLAGTNDLHNRHKPAVSVEIVKISVPSHFLPDRAPRVIADVAVVKLKHPLKLSKHIKKLQLPQHRNVTYYGETAEIAGFGLQSLEPNGVRNDSHLQFGKVDVLETIKVGSTHHKVPEFMLHAKMKQSDDHSKPSGVCQGDSGSPLVHGDTAIGILSQTPHMCSEAEKGALYASVSYYLDFIKDALLEKQHDGIRTHVVHD